jgi:hypothetical protein
MRCSEGGREGHPVDEECIEGKRLTIETFEARCDELSRR